MDKREARRDFKERKPEQGVFALRCKAGGVWVNASPNLEASRNRVFFELRNGLHRNKPLQSAWESHGAENFEFEVIETFDEDVLPMALKDLMRDRQKHWEQELGAASVWI